MKVKVGKLEQGMVLRNGQTVLATHQVGDVAVVVETDKGESIEHIDTEFEVESIDITPTWSALVPIFIGVLQNPKAPVSAHKEAEANLTGMAALADKYVALVKRGSGDTVGLTPVLGDPDQKES